MRGHQQFSDLVPARRAGGGHEVVVEHLHVHLPRVLKAPVGPRTANHEREMDR
ncbi:hypothetical protein ACWGEU_23245 [Streptomyces goshikiensis]